MNWFTSRFYLGTNQTARRVAGLSMFLALACSGWLVQAGEFDDVKLIKSIPFGDAEVRMAYAAAKADSCEQLGDGQPLELSSFAQYLTLRDKQSGKRQPASTRKGFLTIGIDVDETTLPLLSKSKIVDYVSKHYVSVQTRIRRDLLDRQLYYHHRPIALTGQFAGPKLAVAFEPVVAQTASAIRSLGVFVEPDKRIIKAEHLRTLVLAFRFEKKSSIGLKTEQYELAIVRGVPTLDGKSLEPHVFVTQENRTRLSYIKPVSAPRLPSACSIQGNVLITEFDSTTGLYPKKSVTQSYTLATRNEFDRLDLESKLGEDAKGSLAVNINPILDKIISGEIK